MCVYAMSGELGLLQELQYLWRHWCVKPVSQTILCIREKQTLIPLRLFCVQFTAQTK